MQEDPVLNDNDSTKDKERRDKDSKKRRRIRDAERWIHRTMDAYRKGTYPLDFRPDDDFFALADLVINSKRTLLGYDRLYVFWQVARNIAQVPGEVVEVGSYRGGSAFFMAGSLLRMSGGEVPMTVIDTFEGHPQGAISSEDEFHTAGRFSATSYEDVRDYLSVYKEVGVRQGDVLQLLPELPDAQYRLAHIDTDLYKPTVECLAYFGTRMVPGGVIIVDDYASQKCPGVPKAATEYLERVRDFQVWDMRTEQLVLVKR